MRKLIILMFGILFISFTTAGIIGPFKINQDLNLIQTCDDCTYNNITSLIYPNGTLAFTNVAMTKDGTHYNYTVDKSYFQVPGTYIVNGVGDLSGAETVWAYDFQINSAGVEFNTQKSILYVGLLILLLFFFTITIFGITRLPKMNEQDEQGNILSISYFKYLRITLWLFEYAMIIAIFFVASNLAFAYLGEEMIAQLFFALFRISLGLAPLIIIFWFVWIIVKIVQDKKMKQMLQRGISPNQWRI